MSASRNTLALVMNGYQCQGIKTRKEQAANLINDFNLDENLEIRNGGAARSLNVNSRNFFIMSMIPRSTRVANGMLGCAHRSMLWDGPFDVSAGSVCGAILSGTLLLNLTRLPSSTFSPHSPDYS